MLDMGIFSGILVLVIRHPSLTAERHFWEKGVSCCSNDPAFRVAPFLFDDHRICLKQ